MVEDLLHTHDVCDMLTMICHSSRIGYSRWTYGCKERSKRFHRRRWCYSDMDYRQWRQGHVVSDVQQQWRVGNEDRCCSLGYVLDCTLYTYFKRQTEKVMPGGLMNCRSMLLCLLIVGCQTTNTAVRSSVDCIGHAYFIDPNFIGALFDRIRRKEPAEDHFVPKWNRISSDGVND